MVNNRKRFFLSKMPKKRKRVYYVKKRKYLTAVFAKINASIIISLIALSSTVNFNQINYKNSKLDDLYRYSVEYIINLEKNELLFVSKNERSVSTKQEEIKINISNEFYLTLILNSIDEDNRYAKQFKDTLDMVKKNHELEINKLTISYALAVEKEGNFSKDIIEENERKYSNIVSEQNQLTQNNKINLRDEYKKVIIDYYNEEKQINKFKLFLFF